jgi:hypothetical protein
LAERREMDQLLENKRCAESKRSKFQDRVTAYEISMIDAVDKLNASTEKADFVQEITSLEATERWSSERIRLAEATVELASIELAVSRETENADSIFETRLNVELACAKKTHADAMVQRAETIERLYYVRMIQAQNERDQKRCEIMFENASMNLKNALENQRITLKELESLITVQGDTEIYRSVGTCIFSVSYFYCDFFELFD